MTPLPVSSLDEIPDWLVDVCQGSELGARVLRHDWAATPLGPPSTWPQGLRTAVSICLTSHFPILVVWGPELIKIYNDGYRQLLGAEKHPRALGAPAREIWPEIWDQIGPDFDAVMTTGRPTWYDDAPLVLHRNGFAEECFFVWGYSPLFDDDGRIAGVIDVVTETTDKVLSRRRLACLGELSTALLAWDDVTEACAGAARLLGRHRADIAYVDMYLDAGDGMALTASNRRRGQAPVAALDVDVAVERRAATVIGGVVGPQPAETYIVPLQGLGGESLGVMAIGLSAQLPFDDEYAGFLDVVSAMVATALDGAVRHAKEVGTYREIADTIQSAWLEPYTDLPTVAARYRPADDKLVVGGDWYDVIDLGGGRRALVVGDCVGHSLQSATVMGQLRSAARMMLLDGHDPASTLRGLDGFAATIAGGVGTTVLCAVIDRVVGEITYASAGHPPPLVTGDPGVRWLDGGRNVPLAVAEAPSRTNATQALTAGDTIILYTDGLIERRGEVIDCGLTRLADAATGMRGHSVQQIADALLREVAPEAARDDVVVVVKHYDSE